jgi:hypothetical protein
VPFEESRLARILGLLAGRGEARLTTQLCDVSAEVMDMTGAGIMLMAGDSLRGAVCCSDDTSRSLSDLQALLGEGPGIDAEASGRPVFEPDLEGSDETRWFAFTPAAVDAGARAVFSYPLRVGAARLGSLDLYRDQPGSLDADQLRDATVMADVAARAVLLMQAGAPPGRLSADLEEGADLQLVVHQASGMVAVQLGVSLGEALVRLRAYAYGHECRLRDVAADVVDRRLRFDRDRDGNE